MKKGIFVFVLAFTLIASAFVNAEPDKSVKKDKKYTSNSIVVFNNLSLEIDFWHDATLKNDKKAVAKHSQAIFEIISEDIKTNYQANSYAKLDASYIKDENEKKKDFKNDENVLSSKKLLFASLKKSTSFSYSYRLLADYQQLLKKDIDAHKVQMAETSPDSKRKTGFIR